MAFKIQTITAFIAVDENGEEGIMGFNANGAWLPLVGADEARMESMFPMAEQISEISSLPYKVVRFSVATDITEEVRQRYQKGRNI